MVKHRAKIAREQAGLSIGQAAKLLMTTPEHLRAVEESQEAFEDAEVDLRDMMAEIYGVDAAWLAGDKPLRNYAAIDAMRDADKLSFHDRDILAEFAASLPGRRDK